MTASLGQAQQAAAAADHTAEQIARRAAAAGFAGIAHALTAVRTTIQQTHRQITDLTGQVSHATRPVAAAPKEISPAQTIALLTPAAETITKMQDGIRAAIEHVGKARQQAATALQGGQPGPLLGQLDQIRQVLAQTGQRATTARQHLTATIAQAQQIGQAGN